MMESEEWIPRENTRKVLYLESPNGTTWELKIGDDGQIIVHEEVR